MDEETRRHLELLSVLIEKQGTVNKDILDILNNLTQKVHDISDMLCRTEEKP